MDMDHMDMDMVAFMAEGLTHTQEVRPAALHAMQWLKILASLKRLSLWQMLQLLTVQAITKGLQCLQDNHRPKMA